MQNNNKNFSGCSCAIVLFLFAFSTSAALALQVESEKVCSEETEPLVLDYGDYTAGCEISPTTDLDQFKFQGNEGDVITINIQSSTSVVGRISVSVIRRKEPAITWRMALRLSALS